MKKKKAHDPPLFYKILGVQMSVQTIDQKEEQAREIALVLVDFENVDVTVEMLASWEKWDVYEWIEAYGYYWENEEWLFNDEA
jgi:hypothetical protein